MSEADWRTVGYIGLTLGVLLLIGGFITYYFPQDIYILGYYVGTAYPYRDDSVGLFVASVTLLVVGLGLSWRAGIEKTKDCASYKAYSPIFTPVHAISSEKVLPLLRSREQSRCCFLRKMRQADGLIVLFDYH